MANVLIGVNVVDKASGALNTIARELDNLGNKGTSTGKSFSLLNSVLSGAGLGIGIMGVSAAVSTLSSSLSGAIDAASGLAEQQAKANVVFGQSVGAVRAFAQTSAESFAISQRAALEASGTLGNMFTAMGIGQAQAAEMSVEMVKLAGDLASFNNIPIDVALEKLRAGLAGEIEPLRTLGVNLSDVALRQQALAMGLQVTSAPLNAQTKTMAAYELILKQTATAQGDFARTSDSLANQQRTLQAEVDDLAAEIGESLIPAVKELVKGVREGIPVFREAAGLLGEVAGAIGEVGAASSVAANPARDFFNLQRQGEIDARKASEANMALKASILGVGVGSAGSVPPVQVFTGQLGRLWDTSDGAYLALRRLHVAMGAGANYANTAVNAFTGFRITQEQANQATADGVRRHQEYLASLQRTTRATGGAGGLTDKTKELAAAIKEKLATSFDTFKSSALAALEAVHKAKLRAIEDAHKLRDAELDAQAASIRGAVDAERAKVEAARDARRQAELERAVAEAQASGDPEAMASAQQALSDFLEDQRLARLEAEAQAKLDVIALEKTKNDEQTDIAKQAEDTRYEALKTALDKQLKLLDEKLQDGNKKWTVHMAAITKIITNAAPEFEKAGADLGAVFGKGVVTALSKSIIDVAKLMARLLGVPTPSDADLAKLLEGIPGRAGGGYVAAGSPYVVGERGPEVFLPAVSGTVLPNGSTGGDMNVAVTISGPAIFDPLGVGAQQLAALLIPAINRERTRQGVF